ncbi:preprotein translocase subunit TatA [Candidatus Nitromaritima sp. SCGC AAA799-A02]|nr:preprotein translocase subunit TatA [Candidatus Nitromaritima sp. SCGC AAA799-C22]KMP11345.1 preprotein translocase subunit TatA [Candidatus Nitromaritima sp. SCGC AAA799-A02]
MMGIGFPELMIILVIIMIIFGAGKLPEIGSAFGRSIKNFKKSMKEAEAEEIESGQTEAAPAVDAGEPAQTNLTPEEAAAKKEAEMIDEVADEILKNRVDPIKTAHDGLVQQNDVFTNSLRRTPGGRGRERGVSRDVF